MVFSLVIWALFTDIVIAAPSPRSSPIVIPLQESTHLKTKRSNINYAALDILEKREEGETGTLPLHDSFYYLTDIVYLATISIGTPSKNCSRILFDTGSYEPWITGWGTDVNHETKFIFNPNNSTTARDQGSPLTAKYKDGTLITLKLYTESISIAGVNIDNQPLGIATNILTPFYSLPYDGIVGMGYSYYSGSNTILESLVREGAVAHALFGCYFARESHGETGSQLIIGGFDHEKAKKPHYYELSPATSWTIHLDTIRINDRRIKISQNALIDTGTTEIIGPMDMVKKVSVGPDMWDGIPNIINLLFECNPPPSMSFIFGWNYFGGGVEYPISSKDFMNFPWSKNSTLCWSHIAGSKWDTRWIIG